MTIADFLKRFPNTEMFQVGNHQIPVSLTPLDHLKEPLSILFPFPKGVISVKGKDRVDFLQNLLTNDILLLPVGEGHRALLVNTKGQVQFDLLVYKHEEEILLFTDPGNEEECRKQIDFFLVTEDVTLEVVSEAPGIFVLIQLEPAELPPELASNTLYSRSGGQVRFIMNDQGFEFEEKLLQYSQPVGLDLYEQFRPIFGLSRSGADFDMQMNPHEASLKDAVSFKKGCYVGQEPISRIQFRGHPSKKLVVLSSKQPLEAGNPILAGDKKAGGVTTVSQLSLGGKYYSLGYVPYKLLIEETPLELSCGNIVVSIVNKVDE